METASSNRKIGFRHWHERQLWESFAWLVTCLLSAIAIGVILELVGLSTPSFTPLITLLVVYVVGLGAITAFRRFWAILSHAQYCANHATCAHCGAYGLFDVALGADQVPARCRSCDYSWTIE